MTEVIAFPGKTVFGEGAASSLASHLPPNGSILFVSGNHAAESVLPMLLRQFPNRVTRSVTGIAPELPLGEIERVRAAGREINAAIIVAVGGGSVIDAGKAAAALLPLEGPVEDYFYNRRQIPGKGAFFAALPTTAGTGSEATPNSVACDPATGIKQSIRHDGMLPDLALIDPELTWDCPRAITAASGFDALTQAIESAISRKHTIFSFQLALQAAKLLLNALPDAVEGDRAARHDMAYGSMITGMAFAQSGLGAVHGLAHPIGSRCHIPHGVTCAILLPVILRWNRESLTPLAIELGFSSADRLIDHIEELRSELQLPADFRQFNFSFADFDFVIRNCRSGSMKCNPRELSDRELVNILEELA